MQKKLSHQLKGEIFILASATTGSLLPILCNPKSISISPVWMVTFGTAISFLIFLGIFIYKNLFSELGNSKAIKLAVLAGLIIGVLYTGLVYVGSYYTSPQNASIIVSLDVFVAMLLFRKLDSEKLSLKEIIGGTLLVSAGALLFLPSSAEPNIGDLILFCACFVSPIGNLVMKKARKTISTETILLVRSAVASVILIVVALTLEEIPVLENFKASISIVLLNGILVLTLSKLLWIEGINLIPIAKASSLMSISPILTFTFAWIFIKDSPNTNQILAGLVALFGIKLVIGNLAKPITKIGQID
jgi:drug/metabolite transporter (DMT)-like permease